ncbi:MAG: hypothetical protein ABW215_02250 [Kibdelosporangium sp.]
MTVIEVLWQGDSGGQSTARRLILVAAGFVVATVAATSVLLFGDNQQPTAGGPVLADPTSEPSRPSSTPVPTESSAAPPAPAEQRQPVDGPLGLKTVLPTGWGLTETTATYLEAEPAARPPGPRTFLRSGISPALPEDLLITRTAYEQRFQTSVQNYQRIRMEKFAYARKQAVVWDFKWNEGPAERRARVVNWQEANAEYYIYLSAPTWTDETDKLFDFFLVSTRVG